MKRSLLAGLLIALIFLSIVTWFSSHKQTEDCFKGQCVASQEILYINSNGEVTDPIVRLLGLTGIRITGDPLEVEKDWPEERIQIKSRKLEDVVPVVQGKRNPAITWFGDTKKERWEEDPKKLNLSRIQSNKIVNLCLASLRLGEKISSQQVSPRAILFLGATLISVRKRLAYLNELYETRNLSVDLPVYLLMGERQLDEKAGETQQNLMDPKNGIIPFRNDWQESHESITDEGEMIKLVFAQSRHKALEEINVIPVYSLKGERSRANTESTVVQWLKEDSPQWGSYVAISNQPYNFYQECVIRRVLLQAGRSDICVEVVGPGIEAKTETDEVAIDQAKNLLNNLSRILLELLEIRKMTQ